MKNTLPITLRAAALALIMAAGSSAAFAQTEAATKKIKDHRSNPEVFFLQEGDVPNSYLILPSDNILSVRTHETCVPTKGYSWVS